jgi:DNA-binding NtrC family response regulator
MRDLDEKIRIIIIEPAPVVASTLKEILNLKGYEASAFTDPIQGLDAVLAEGPNLVIAAVVMPEATGIELAIQVKQSCLDCKILLWSGAPETTILIKMAQAQGYEFEIIPKPIYPEALLSKIREVISDPLVAQGA